MIPHSTRSTPSRFAVLAGIALAALMAGSLCVAPACRRGSDVELTSEPTAESRTTPSEPAGGDRETTVGSNYVIHHPALSLGTDAPGRLELRVTPAGGFKINTEYPWLLTISPPDALALERTEWDVSTVDRLTEDEAQFTIPVSADEAGQHQVDGHLRFSVCNDVRCDTPQARLSWSVSVE